MRGVIIKQTRGAWLLGAFVLVFASLSNLTSAQDSKAFVEETVSVATIPSDIKHTVYLTDLAFTHLVDGLLRIVDGDSLRFLGTVSLGNLGLFNTSRDGRELYVASSYYERLNRGTRTDTLAIYDAKTLLLTKEIVIPPKHAQEIPNPAFLVPAWNSPMLYVQNATPASSVLLVDTDTGKVLTEVQTAGCFGIFPSTKSPTRFSTLCGDGSVLTVSLDAAGQELSRKHSGKLFDPDGDALFIGLTEDADRVVFVSFLGMIHTIDVSGETAAETEAPWPTVSTVLVKEGWRPGGTQTVAYHIASKQLFLTMHRDGFEGSHKQPADEIWQVDGVSHRVVKRIPAGHALGLTVTQDEKPLLFAVDADDGSMRRYDVSLGLKRTGRFAAPLLESPTNLLVR